MVRGTGLVYPKAFVEERFGVDAWCRLLGSLSPVESAQIASARNGEWYDLRLLAALERGIGALWGSGGSGVLRDLGRFEAERDLDCAMRWFFRVVPPDLAIQQIDLYWRRFHDSGRWTSDVRSREIIATLSGWGAVEPAMCATLSGYLSRVLEVIGCSGAVDHAECRARGDRACTFVLGWHRPSAPPPCSVRAADIVQIGRELSQIPDRTALARAMTDVLVRLLGFPAAALWEGSPGVGSPLASAGAPRSFQGAVHRFLLEARGHAQAWLELAADGGGERHEALEHLLPWLGVALSGAPRTTVPADERSARVDRARLKWSLTPRQTEVLACVALGLANKEIAADLGVSEGTVEIHVTQILKKAGADNRASLVARIWT